MSDLSNTWYLVYTKPKKEALVEILLNTARIKTMYPLIKEVNTKGLKSTSGVKPLFPRYVFVYISEISDFNKIKWMPGVNRFVSFGESPASVDDRSIEILKSQIDDDGFIRKNILKKGDHVKVKEGVFKGLTGILDNDISPSGRVKVLLDLLHYQGRLQVPEVLLESCA